jgi:hypothetical protein
MPLLVRPVYNKPPNAYLLVLNNIPRRRNPHSLAATHYGDNEQRKPAHDGRKPTKRDQETILLNPLRNKESPRKGNQTPQNADHDEAVTGQLVVRVDELESKKATSVKSSTATKPHFQDSTLT